MGVGPSQAEYDRRRNHIYDLDKAISKQKREQNEMTPLKNALKQ